MDCPRPVLEEQAAFLGGLYRKFTLNRVPLAGTIELTRRCNLRCVHCYLDAETRGGAELDTSPWREIIDQAVSAGCLDLLITGGEPLLRRDFAALYAHARESGLVVTVFTNATLLTDDIVDLFRELPPQLVEVSLYGATARTYESITGVPGSYAKCLAGIRRLLDQRVKVGLKTMLMTLNRHELDDMRRMARDRGVKFRFDAALFPRFSGDRLPVSLRVPHQEAVAAELCEPGTEQSWRKQCALLDGQPIPETIYHCGAGHTGFHIDAAGNLQPCLMATDPGFPVLTGGGFLKGWREVIPGIVNRTAGSGVSRCQSCTIRALCSYCPAFSKLEMGSEMIPSPYLCAMAHERDASLRDR